MASPLDLNRAFRTRLRAGSQLFGTFLKIGSSHATEIVGELGYDFVIIDQEHSPFDRATVDLLILAARAAGIAPLVRVAESAPSAILSILDSGGAGILVPHVDSPAKAQAAVAACRYDGGTRGFSNTTRAGGYGAASLPSLIESQDISISCIAMIEDKAALDDIDAIVSIPGLDAVFIGRADLAVALGERSLASQVVQSAVETIGTAARRAGLAVVGTASGKDDAARMRAIGATAQVLSADVSLFRRAAAEALEACRPDPANPAS